MVKKKICMLGAFAAGKTSLVRRYVHSLFSEKYHTTVGVKIDKKTVVLDDRTVELILWDIYGEDEFQEVRASYLRGAAGCLLVVDGTRADTLATAHTLLDRLRQAVGAVPVVYVFNKSDLMDQWEIEPGQVQALQAQGQAAMVTSAKEGSNVEAAFTALARLTVEI